MQPASRQSSFDEPRSFRHRFGRSGFTLAAVIGILVLGAGPALADPAGPSNYESTVMTVTPPSNSATFEVVGGDSFLVVTVVPGHELLVPGYFGEPYVRVDADGSVWVNEDSKAHYINQDRYANVPIPDDVDGEGEPRWLRVGDDGTYAWHDHRIHWMAADVPPAVDVDVRSLVFPWELPANIDGQDTTIMGELVWVPSQSAIAPLLVGIIALLPLAAWRPDRALLLAMVAAAAAVVAIGITIAQNNGNPAAVRSFPTWIAAPAAALLAAAMAFARSRVGPGAVARITVVAGLLLTAWALATVDVLWLPVLPSVVSADLERAAVSYVLWAGVGVAGLSAATSILSARRQGQ